MIIDLIEDGQVIGAMGIHVQSGAIITVNSKATILCAGAGSYKPTGYPTGSCTFDGEAMGYRHHLPIAGKEFSDFHGTNSSAPGNAFDTWGWTYFENVWLTGGVPAHEPELTLASVMSTAGAFPRSPRRCVFRFRPASAEACGRDFPRTIRVRASSEPRWA